MTCPWLQSLEDRCPAHGVPLKDCPLPAPGHTTVGETLRQLQVELLTLAEGYRKLG